MVQSVTAEDGTIHNFPDEATPQMIAGALGVKPPSPDFMDRMKSDYSQRVANDQVSRDAYNKGEQSTASTGLQMLGQGAGMVNDTLANAAGSVARTVYDASVDPRSNADFIKAKDFLVNHLTLDAEPETSPSMVSRGIDYLNKNYPVSMRDVGAVGNIAAAVPTLGSAISSGANAADKLYQAGSDAFQARKLAAVQDVVLPKQTAGEIANTALQRTTGGLLNKQVYTPTAREADMIQIASDVGVKPGAALETNIQTVNTAKNAEAQRLKFALDKANVPIGKDALDSAGAQIVQKIAANPLVDENSSTVTKILKAGQDAIDNNPKTAAGILQARKDFDNAIQEFQPSVFNEDAPATAFRSAAKAVRQGMNGVVAQAVPTADVTSSLTKQSHMYDIIDNMAGKLSQQPTSGPARFFAKPAGKALKYAAAAAGGGAALKAVAGGTNTPQINYSSGEE